MGGGSGGSYSPINLEKITEAANQRIQAAFSEERSILFVCHSSDESEVKARIEKSGMLRGRHFDISNEDDDNYVQNVAESSFVVCFSNRSDDHSHINRVISAAAAARKQVVFVKGDGAESIPSYVAQFRVRTLSWSGLIEILAG